MAHNEQRAYGQPNQLKEQIRINRDTKLLKVLTAFCSKKKLEYRTVQFIYNGERFNLEKTPNDTGEVVIVVAAITDDLLEDDNSGGGGVVEDGDLVHVLDDGAGLEDRRREAVEVEAVGLLEVLELVSPLGGDDGGGTGAEAAVVDAGGGGGVVG
ncbi:hypothetical protein RJ640_022095 [Escallonia rubra]|uniref:Rad60/SUMO-like domain-containing protein n=1 Tax=Escallonia rubra TaxID=112253 RepID=A0AA88QXU5_9ASTE|nr:hypothetical protein RJ640_022095 [Escallonia rubra]